MDEKLVIYVAAPFVNKAEAKAAKKKFEEAGFVVNSRWIDEDLGLTNEDVGKPEHQETLERRAIEDVEDVVSSDILVLLNLNKSEGKATELGIAYAIGLPIILIGPRTGNIFYLLPAVFQADSVETAIAGIKISQQMDTEREVSH